jgi:hypothetical protein
LAFATLFGIALFATPDRRHLRDIRTLATILAVAKLEELRASPAPAGGSDTVDGAGEPVSIESSRQFERRWSVTPLSPRASILSVQVTPSPRGLTGLPVRITGGWIVVRR